jgi:hypothetical protein
VGVINLPVFTKVSINKIRIAIKNDRIYAIVPNVNSHNQFKAGIFTVTGRRIYSATIRANNAAVNIPAKGFPAGRYIMSITDDSNRALSSAFLLIR